MEALRAEVAQLAQEQLSLQQAKPPAQPIPLSCALWCRALHACPLPRPAPATSPGTDGPAAQACTRARQAQASAEGQLSELKVCPRLNGSTAQRLNGSTAQRLNGSTAQTAPCAPRTARGTRRRAAPRSRCGSSARP